MCLLFQLSLPSFHQSYKLCFTFDLKYLDNVKRIQNMKKKIIARKDKTVLNTVCEEFNLSPLFKLRRKYLPGKDTFVCGQDGQLFVRTKISSWMN